MPPHAHTKSNPQRVLRPQDLWVLLRLSRVRPADDTPTYAVLAAELALTASEVHGAVGRAIASQLVLKDENGWPRPSHDRQPANQHIRRPLPPRTSASPLGSSSAGPEPASGLAEGVRTSYAPKDCGEAPRSRSAATLAIGPDITGPRSPRQTRGPCGRQWTLPARRNSAWRQHCRSLMRSNSNYCAARARAWASSASWS